MQYALYTQKCDFVLATYQNCWLSRDQQPAFRIIPGAWKSASHPQGTYLPVAGFRLALVAANNIGCLTFKMGRCSAISMRWAPCITNSASWA
jgi:hypothetical protein